MRRGVKIVTDGKGLYAIRKGWIWHEFFDLKAPGFWWYMDSRFYLDCWAQKDVVERWYGLLNPKVAVVVLDSNDSQKGKNAN